MPHILPKTTPKVAEPRRNTEPRKLNAEPVKLNKCKQDSEPQDILWGCLDREIKVQEKII